MPDEDSEFIDDGDSVWISDDDSSFEGVGESEPDVIGINITIPSMFITPRRLFGRRI